MSVKVINQSQIILVHSNDTKVVHISRDNNAHYHHKYYW